MDMEHQAAESDPPKQASTSRAEILSNNLQDMHSKQQDQGVNGQSDQAASIEDEEMAVSVADDKSHVSVNGRQTQRKEAYEARGSSALLEMYEHEGEWEDEEEDDDWEPSQPRIEWWCMNCLFPNPDEASNCMHCREHRKSAILKHGFLAPRFSPEGTDETETEQNRKSGQGLVEGNITSAQWFSSLRKSTRSVVGITAIGFDERMLLHSEVIKKPTPHPERPTRLQSILGGLAAAGLLPGRCVPFPAREATRAELEAVHTHGHVDAVEATAGTESSFFTPDTYANQHSALAARLAAGLCIDLAKAIMNGQVLNGFALVRPPGHHAESATSMGFCLHNNAAVAAKAAQAAGAKKVLIVDWDVHHGNGTQEVFEDDSSVLYISLHRHDRFFYPGTGAPTEVGCNEGEGFSVNIPWMCGGVKDNDYLFAFQQIVLPIASQFNADLTIISAGFDAARGDPLGGCKVTPLGYAHMTHMLSSLTAGRLLVVLEGGYNLRSISASAAAVIKVLSGEVPDPGPVNIQPSKPGLAVVLRVCSIHARYWQFPAPLLRMSARYAAANAKPQEGVQPSESSSRAEEPPTQLTVLKECEPCSCSEIEETNSMEIV